MIVVTGASGLIGGNLVRELLKQGKRVRCLVHRDISTIQNLPIEVVFGSILNPDDLLNAFKSAEIVYHLAAEVSINKKSISRLYRTNIEGVTNVVNACQKMKVRRLVHMSSVQALQQTPYTTPVTEKRNLVQQGEDVSPYDLSKAMAEIEIKKAQDAGLETIILNPTGVIGLYDYKPSLLGRAILQIARGRFPALITGGFNWVDARDVAQAAVAAEYKGEAGKNYLLSGGWHSVAELANKICQIVGRRHPKLVLPRQLAYLCTPAAELISGLTGNPSLLTRQSLDVLGGNPLIDSSKAKAQLGFNSRPFDTTISDTIAWFKSNSFL